MSETSTLWIDTKAVNKFLEISVGKTIESFEKVVWDDIGKSWLFEFKTKDKEKSSGTVRLRPTCPICKRSINVCKECDKPFDGNNKVYCLGDVHYCEDHGDGKRRNREIKDEGIVG